MRIYAEIYTVKANKTPYWNHGIYILDNWYNEYYWVPHLGSYYGKCYCNVSCILHKTSDEEHRIYNAKSYTFIGFKFKPEDLKVAE